MTGAGALAMLCIGDVPSPRVFIVKELWRGLETTVTSIVKGLRDGRVFHHDTTVK
jgi:hypothetical protein